MLAFFVELGLVTYRDVTQGGDKVPQKAPIHAPLPSLYTSAIIIFGGLALLPKSLDPVPGLVGWGFVVATLLNLFTPGSANAARTANAQAVQGLTSSATTTKTTATK
jgi:hypothetical protein